ncbi:MAG: hypothetical protein BMS9Abin10_1089 [Gammaproteobacteria bacterium]|nr:MAG: hypothetical protein BMS9Abin10_1089 [Gammaproteobacteria bacterium]
MFVVFVCTIWACASEPYAVYDRIEPCRALAVVLTRRLNGVDGMKGVCK